MPNQNQDDLPGDFARSPLSAPLGEQPRSDVWARIWYNTAGLAVFLSAFAGLGSLTLLITGDSLVFGIVGPLLMAASGVVAVLGYRRRLWTWLVSALAVAVVWSSTMMLVLQ